MVDILIFTIWSGILFVLFTRISLDQNQKIKKVESLVPPIFYKEGTSDRRIGIGGLKAFKQVVNIWLAGLILCTCFYCTIPCVL